MASGRLADTFIGNENECARSLVQFGRNTSSAAPQAAPANDGGGRGLIVRPFSPPNVAGNLSARAGRPTASARVAPARYGPRSRLAATPTGTPTISVTMTAATSAGSSAQPSLPTSSAT